MKQLSYLIIIAILTFGCATGKKALEQGDYDLAVMQAVKKLKSNSKKEKSLAALRKAYTYAVERHLDKIETFRASSDEMKWESVYEQYAQVNSLYNAVKSCPACREVVPNPVRFVKEEADAKNLAADKRYELGNKAMQNKTVREQARTAYDHYSRADQLASGRFADLPQKLDESLYFATLWVVVEPIPRPSKSLTLEHEYLVNKINTYLAQNPPNRFVQFVTSRVAKADKLPVDHFVVMEFDQLVIGQLYRNKETDNVTRDSVKVESDRGGEVYKTFKAKRSKFGMMVDSRCVLDLRVLQAGNNRVLEQQKMPASFRWEHFWVTVEEGDVRALSDDEYELSKLGPVPPPANQVLFDELAGMIYQQVTGFMRDYYRRY